MSLLRSSTNNNAMKAGNTLNVNSQSNHQITKTRGRFSLSLDNYQSPEEQVKMDYPDASELPEEGITRISRAIESIASPKLTESWQNYLRLGGKVFVTERANSRLTVAIHDDEQSVMCIGMGEDSGLNNLMNEHYQSNSKLLDDHFMTRLIHELGHDMTQRTRIKLGDTNPEQYREIESMYQQVQGTFSSIASLHFYREQANNEQKRINRIQIIEDLAELMALYLRDEVSFDSYLSRLVHTSNESENASRQEKENFTHLVETFRTLIEISYENYKNIQIGKVY